MIFKSLVEANSTEFKVIYNSQNFLGLFIKFYGKMLTGTLIVFKSGHMNSVGLKRPDQFSELEEWSESIIHYV